MMESSRGQSDSAVKRPQSRKQGKFLEKQETDCPLEFPEETQPCDTDLKH